MCKCHGWKPSHYFLILLSTESLFVSFQTASFQSQINTTKYNVTNSAAVNEEKHHSDVTSGSGAASYESKLKIIIVLRYL